MSKWNAFRPYQKGDLLSIWDDLREEDRREYEAVGLTDPRFVEAFSLFHCTHLRTWDSDKGPIMVIGVSPDADPMVGHIWAIANTEFYRRWRFAQRSVKEIFAALSKGYSVISNVKDSRNTKQIAWLKKHGFTFFRTIPDYEGSGVTFYEFARIVS